MRGVQVVLASVIILVSLGVGLRMVCLSWAFSAFTGERKWAVVWLVFCVVVLVASIGTMQLLLS